MPDSMTTVTAIQGETVSFVVPLVSPKEPPLPTQSIKRVGEEQVVVSFSNPLPYYLRTRLEGYLFLKGGVNGCFEILSVDTSCYKSITLSVPSCIHLEAAQGRYVRTCCGGLVVVPGVPTFALVPLPDYRCGCDEGSVDLDLRSHVVSRTERQHIRKVALHGDRSLSIPWDARVALPQGVMIDVPGLNISQATVVRQQLLQGNFVILHLDKRIEPTDSSCHLHEVLVCDTTKLQGDYVVVENCPMVEITWRGTDELPEGVYHWDLLLKHGDKATLIDRGSLKLETGY